MNSLPTNPRINRRGFTLTEMMVAGAIFNAVGLAMVSLILSTMQLSSANMVTNLSGFRARQTLDHLARTIRYAQDMPVLIDTNGAPVSGTTADGVLIKNALGGPYVIKNADGSTNEIVSGATSFTVEYSISPDVNAPKPSVGDFLDINLATAPELEITSVSSPTTVLGSVVKVAVTTKTGLKEKASPAKYTVSATLYRKEAYVFAQVGDYWSLRYYPYVTSSTAYSTAANYRVLGTGFQKLSSQSWLTTFRENGTAAIWVRAIARSSDQNEYVQERTGKKTLTTMPMQGKIWNYNAPPTTN